MKRRILLTAISLMMFSVLNAQLLNPKYTYNVEIGLPVSTVNDPFNEIMRGIIRASTYGQYSFPFHLHAGAGVHYSYFSIDDVKGPPGVSGGVHSVAGFLKVGWDKFHSDRFATDFGVQYGYSQNYVATDLNRANFGGPVQINSTFMEFKASFILKISDEPGAYRWTIGYGGYGFGFKLSDLGLESNEGYDPSKLNKITQYFVVGLGYTHYFKSSK